MKIATILEKIDKKQLFVPKDPMRRPFVGRLQCLAIRDWPVAIQACLYSSLEIILRARAGAVLAICLIVAPLQASPVQDTSKGESLLKQGKQTAPKALLKSLEGSWEGTCRTWFKPDTLADESKVKGKIVPILGGRLMRHEYEGSMQGKPRHGEETISFNSITKRFQISWVDDFHMGSAILFSEGEASERGFTVKGKYDYPNTPPWGWKTVFEVVDKDHLTITAYNIQPNGQEAKAVETVYSRIK